MGFVTGFVIYGIKFIYLFQVDAPDINCQFYNSKKGIAKIKLT